MDLKTMDRDLLKEALMVVVMAISPGLDGADDRIEVLCGGDDRLMQACAAVLVAMAV